MVWAKELDEDRQVREEKAKKISSARGGRRGKGKATLRGPHPAD